MSILIKGMEMPTSCGNCKVFVCYRQWAGDAGDCFCGITKSDAIVGARNDDCPLVLVPPHGKLIEKGVLLDKCYQHFEDYMWRKVDGKTALLNIEKEIKAASTILDAEEGET